MASPSFPNTGSIRNLINHFTPPEPQQQPAPASGNNGNRPSLRKNLPLRQSLSVIAQRPSMVKEKAAQFEQQMKTNAKPEKAAKKPSPSPKIHIPEDLKPNANARSAYHDGTMVGLAFALGEEALHGLNQKQIEDRFHNGREELDHIALSLGFEFNADFQMYVSAATDEYLSIEEMQVKSKPVQIPQDVEDSTFDAILDDLLIEAEIQGYEYLQDLNMFQKGDNLIDIETLWNIREDRLENETNEAAARAIQAQDEEKIRKNDLHMRTQIAPYSEELLNAIVNAAEEGYEYNHEAGFFINKENNDVKLLEDFRD